MKLLSEYVFIKKEIKKYDVFFQI
jgi:hypothetical protein